MRLRQSHLLVGVPPRIPQLHSRQLDSRGVQRILSVQRYKKKNQIAHTFRLYAIIHPPLSLRLHTKSHLRSAYTPNRHCGNDQAAAHRRTPEELPGQVQKDAQQIGSGERGKGMYTEFKKTFPRNVRLRVTTPFHRVMRF